MPTVVTVESKQHYRNHELVQGVKLLAHSFLNSKQLLPSGIKSLKLGKRHNQRRQRSPEAIRQGKQATQPNRLFQRLSSMSHLSILCCQRVDAVRKELPVISFSSMDRPRTASNANSTLHANKSLSKTFTTSVS